MTKIEEKIYKRFNEKLALTAGPAAVGVAKVISEAAKAAAIGRELMWVIETDQLTLLVPKAGIGSATIVTNDTYDADTDEGESYTYGTVDVNRRVFSGQSWTEGFIEEVPFSVVERQIQGVGTAIGKEETADIFAMFGAISSGDLAGGTIGTLAGTITMADLSAMVTDVKGGDYVPTVIVMTPELYGELLKDEKFTSSLYTEEQVLGSGLRSLLLGCKILVTSLCIANTIFCIDATAAAVLAIRSDLEIKDWENGQTGKMGIRARERMGRLVLRGTAVAKYNR